MNTVHSPAIPEGKAHRHGEVVKPVNLSPEDGGSPGVAVDMAERGDGTFSLTTSPPWALTPMKRGLG